MTGTLIGILVEDLLRDPVESFGPSGREHHVVTPEGWVVVSRDVTELADRRRELATVIEQLRSELADQARRDPLTGLHNRRHLVERLEVLLGADVADEGGTAADALAPVGVILLVAVAREFASDLPPDAVLVRYGGEEFVFLLPGWSPDRTAELAESIRVRCAQVAVPGRDDQFVRCTISAGVAASPRRRDDR